MKGRFNSDCDMDRERPLTLSLIHRLRVLTLTVIRHDIATDGTQSVDLRVSNTPPKNDAKILNDVKSAFVGPSWDLGSMQKFMHVRKR
jgi:hypothetical protein